MARRRERSRPRNLGNHVVWVCPQPPQPRQTRPAAIGPAGPRQWRVPRPAGSPWAAVAVGFLFPTLFIRPMLAIVGFMLVALAVWDDRRHEAAEEHPGARATPDMLQTTRADRARAGGTAGRRSVERFG